VTPELPPLPPSSRPRLFVGLRQVLTRYGRSLVARLWLAMGCSGVAGLALAICAAVLYAPEQTLALAEAVGLALGGVDAQSLAIGAGAIGAALIGVAFWAARSTYRLATRTPGDVLSFLEGLRYDDLSAGVPHLDQGPMHRALSQAVDDVRATIRKTRGEREAQVTYLEAVVRHVGVALVGFTAEGEVTLFNTAARRLLGLPGLAHLDALGSVSAELVSTLRTLESGRRALVRVAGEERTLELVVYASRFQLGGGEQTLASLQDIRQELEEKEMAAWQQLTRVLTHEIMNSMAPIQSLAETTRGLVASPERANPDAADQALETIGRRASGLVSFVESYRSLSRLPRPTFAIVEARPLLEQIARLMRSSAREAGVALDVDAPGTVELAADAEQIEQVLINLTLNAIQASSGLPGARVTLSADAGATGRARIHVSDNGPGILPEVQERVFVPFFSTKPGGSGIGLGLSRQIMRLHGGTLTVQSALGQGATFTLAF
jgi:signal transduction histidine kinase